MEVEDVVSLNDKYDYNTALTTALSELRDFHDQNMYALSASEYV